MARIGRDFPGPPRAPAQGRSTGDRRLSIAGVAGGVGTTTLAFALRGVDRGVFIGGIADVLVCRASSESLARAGGTARLIAVESSRPPVLAITAPDASGLSRAVKARIRLMEPHVRGVVIVPHVRPWRDVESPIDELRAAFTGSYPNLPRHLRGYLAAIRDIRAIAIGTPAISTARVLAPAHRSGLKRPTITSRSLR